MNKKDPTDMFVISRFECITLCAQQKSSQPEAAVKKYMGSTHKFSANKETSLAVKKTLLVLARLRSSMQMSARIFNHNELFPLEV